MQYSQGYTFRIKRDGKVFYFSLGDGKKDSEKLADEIDAFLSVKSNSMEDAILKFAPEKAERKAGSDKKVPTVGEFIVRYKSRTGHLRPTTVRDNCTAIRRITAFAIGLKTNKKKMTKVQLERWRSKVDGTLLSVLTPEIVEDFRQDMIQKAGTDNLRHGRALTTSNFYITIPYPLLPRSARQEHFLNHLIATSPASTFPNWSSQRRET
jgi:hypothetical protein